MREAPAAHRYRYEELVDYIMIALDENAISSGEKLPSLREMSSRFDCSLSVVMQAYGELEVRGLIRAVEKSGFFALPPPAAEGELPAPEKEGHSLCEETIRPLSIIGRIVEASNSSDILPLGAGLPETSLLPIAALKRSLTRVAREEQGLYGRYTDEAGDPLLRLEIARFMLRRRVETDADEILISNGCTEALMLAILSCTEVGDAVAVESPVFLGVLQILKETGRQVIPIPTSPDRGMDMDALESVFASGRTRVGIITPAFQNPLGFVMPEKNRKRAAEIARRWDSVLIEDDIYSDCSFGHELHRPIRSFDTDGRVIYCSSFSKTISPGMRIGWIMAGRYSSRVGSLKTSHTLGGNPLTQRAMALFLRDASYGRHIRNFRKAIARQSAATRRLLIEHLPAGSRISAPEGGLYLWVELPIPLDATVLFERALKEGIGLAPGSAFGNNGRYSNCFRISCGSGFPMPQAKGSVVSEN